MSLRKRKNWCAHLYRMVRVLLNSYCTGTSFVLGVLLPLQAEVYKQRQKERTTFFTRGGREDTTSKKKTAVQKGEREIEREKGGTIIYVKMSCMPTQEREEAQKYM